MSKCFFLDLVIWICFGFRALDLGFIELKEGISWQSLGIIPSSRVLEI